MFANQNLKSIAVLAFAVLACMVEASPVQAREVIKGRARLEDLPNVNGGDIEVEDEDDSSSEPEDAPEKSSAHALQLLIHGATYESKYRTKIPTMKQAHRSACYSAPTMHRRSICRSWPTVNQSFEAAGKTLGLPAPALVCLMKAESNFVPGQTSPVGAAGLTQFMPGTARRFQRLMSSSAEYQQKWEVYRKNGGSSRRRSAFTAANIRSGSGSMADVQIFATAMYFHDSMKGMESTIRRGLGAPPEPNATGLKRLMHYWLVAYNAGETRGRQFLARVRTDRYAYNRLPSETQGYIRKFDKCMAQAARY